ncbi:MAG: hypothetical protein Q9218_001739 [Villophora microphyllina]
MDEQEEVGLDLVAEKTMQTPVKPNQLAYCPTMDLLALATADERVEVFRVNGQRVFGVNRDDSAGNVTSLQWKPDGQSLAVAFGHTMCIASAHTGKVMYKKESLATSKAAISCLGWASTFTDTQAVRISLAQLADGLTLDDLIDSVGRATGSSAAPDLPMELALIDVATLLPKLSTLPIGGSQGDIFSSRASLDTLFRPLSTVSAEFADVLVIGHEDGTIHISMSEDFAIGTFNLKDVGPKLSGSKPFLHCSHPFSTTHALLVSPNPDHNDSIQLIPFDLRLLSSAGKYLSLLAAKVTELHNLLRYLRQVQEQISNEIRTSQDLPSKFMRNIEESLQEKSDCTWVQAAYHLVLTGHCYPDVKEWLVDELGERGHKRWDKAVTTGYETVRRLTHENLLPALDRLGVLISRLRGLSRFQASDILLGLSTLELDNMLDSVHCLQLLSHHLLRCAGSELQQFAAFSVWLRHEIEKQAADPTSASAQEIVDKDTDFDHGSILEYIQGAMTHSQMSIYSGNQAENESHFNIGSGVLFELYKKNLVAVGVGHAVRKHLPGLDSLISHFQRQSESFFERISETQRRNVHFGTAVQLGNGNSACTDMRMVDEVCVTSSGEGKGKLIPIVKTDSEATVHFSIYVAVGPSQTQNSVHIIQVNLAIETGVSSTKSVKHAWIPVPTGAVLSIKFIDDEFMMLTLVERGGKLQSFDGWTRSLTDTYSGGLTYQDSGLNSTAESYVHDLRDPKVLAGHTIQRLPAGQAWTPQALEINGRKGRRTLCVLAKDGIHCRQYALDKLDEEANDGEESDVAMSDE